MTLTPEQRAAGWREHDGGPCPVPFYSKPGVIMANGVNLDAGVHPANTWGGFPDLWKHEHDEELNIKGRFNIIAYLPDDTSHDQ